MSKSYTDCFTDNVCMNTLICVDDTCLVVPTPSSLQEVLIYEKVNSISLNNLKSVYMHVCMFVSFFDVYLSCV